MKKILFGAVVALVLAGAVIACNNLAGGKALARPDAYAAYWESLLGSGDEHAAVPAADARERARALLESDLDAALSDPRIEATLRKAEELFGRTSSSEKSGVPRLIHGQRWLTPESSDADELLELIRTEL